MKKILLTSIVAVMATFAANASVAPYVSLHGGYDTYKVVISEEDHERYIDGMLANSAYDLSGAFGVKYDATSSLGIRGEIEYDFADARHVGVGGLKMDFWRAHTALVNGYIDFKTTMGLNPYFSAGIGYQWTNHNDSQGDWIPQMHGLAYQLGTGVSYDINKNITVDLGYRYLALADKVEDSGAMWELQSVFHQLRLGATYTF